MDDMKFVGPVMSVIGLSLSIVGIYLCRRKSASHTDLTYATDGELIQRGRWDECTGEPMNEYAEEFERREAAAQVKENDRE